MTVGFSGFADGKQSLVSLPAAFFSDLLPQIDHVGELKVTLYCFWAVQAQEGAYRYIRFKEAAQDQLLLQGLVNPHTTPEEALQDAFERAVARGTLLHVQLQWKQNLEDVYFINTEKGRLAVKAINDGDWLPNDGLRPIALIVERPNLFVKYEQNIGMLTPLIVDQLRDLEKEYSTQWLDAAIEAAALRHVNNLGYIIGILKRWKREGQPIKGDGKRQGGSPSKLTENQMMEELRKELER